MARTPRQKHLNKEAMIQLCVYIRPVNAEYARFVGKKKCGSASAFVDELITYSRKNTHVALSREFKKQHLARMPKAPFAPPKVTRKEFEEEL